jgi:hypothetical protein
MKLKITFLSMFLVSIFLSCKKEDPLVMPESGAILLKQVIIDNQPTFEYTYNDEKLISEEKSKFDFVVHHYNDDNLLVTTDLYANFDIFSSNPDISDPALDRQEWVTPLASNKGGTIKYEYNDKVQLVKLTYTPEGGNSQYSELAYNADDQINKQILYWGNKQTGYIEYTYDSYGNLTEESLYNMTSAGAPELSTTTQYSFDQKTNPFKSAGRHQTPGISTNKNNIIKETYIIHMKAGQGSDKVQTTETTYKYNGNGYPISKNGNVVYIYG